MIDIGGGLIRFDQFALFGRDDLSMDECFIGMRRYAAETR
jgi:hypothetical protein